MICIVLYLCNLSSANDQKVFSLCLLWIVYKNKNFQKGHFWMLVCGHNCMHFALRPKCSVTFSSYKYTALMLAISHRVYYFCAAPQKMCLNYLQFMSNQAVVWKCNIVIIFDCMEDNLIFMYKYKTVLLSHLLIIYSQI